MPIDGLPSAEQDDYILEFAENFKLRLENTCSAAKGVPSNSSIKQFKKDPRLKSLAAELQQELIGGAQFLALIGKAGNELRRIKPEKWQELLEEIEITEEYWKINYSEFAEKIINLKLVNEKPFLINILKLFLISYSLDGSVERTKETFPKLLESWIQGFDFATSLSELTYLEIAIMASPGTINTFSRITGNTPSQQTFNLLKDLDAVLKVTSSQLRRLDMHKILNLPSTKIQKFESKEEPIEVKRRTKIPVKILIKSNQLSEPIDLYLTTDKDSADKASQSLEETLKDDEEVIAVTNMIPRNKNKPTNHSKLESSQITALCEELSPISIPKMDPLMAVPRNYSFFVTNLGRFLAPDKFKDVNADTDYIAHITKVCLNYINNPAIEVTDIPRTVESEIKRREASTQKTETPNASEPTNSLRLDELPVGQTVVLGQPGEEDQAPTPKNIDELVEQTNRRTINRKVEMFTRILPYNHRGNKPQCPRAKAFEAAQVAGITLHMRVFDKTFVTEIETVALDDMNYLEFKDTLAMAQEQYDSDQFEIRCETFVDCRKTETDNVADNTAEKIEGALV